MITADSRYASATIQTIQGPDGLARQEMAIAFPTAVQIQYTYYRVKQGDRLDALASLYYDNPDYWWVIANANPEILSWLPMPVGASIRIPNA